MSIKKGKKYLVEKRNVLNELRDPHMTVQAMRFFSIYLARINARDPSTRVVTFPAHDFQKIMDLETLNYVQLKQTFKTLLQHIVTVPDEKGGFSAFQLFKKCKFERIEDEYGKEEWVVSIDAHDDALPLMFDFKNKYFTYELWNVLRLKSSNQIRLYELMKQYEFAGERVLSIKELRDFLCLKDEYPLFKIFRRDVLEPCRKSIKENTDITFSYEVHQRGARGKILSLKFTIEKNSNYQSPLSLENFLTKEEIHQAASDTDVVPALPPPTKKPSPYDDPFIIALRSACNDEFKAHEVIVLNDSMTKYKDFIDLDSDEKRIAFLESTYHDMCLYRMNQTIEHPLRYLRSIIENKGAEAKKKVEQGRMRRRKKQVLG